MKTHSAPVKSKVSIEHPFSLVLSAEAKYLTNGSSRICGGKGIVDASDQSPALVLMHSFN